MSDLEQAQQQIAQLNQQIVVLNQNINSLALTNENFTNQTNLLKEELAQKEDDLSKLKDKYVSILHQKCDLENQLEQRQSTESFLSEQMIQKDEEISNLQGENEKIQTELVKQTKENQALLSNIRQLDHQLQQQKNKKFEQPQIKNTTRNKDSIQIEIDLENSPILQQYEKLKMVVNRIDGIEQEELVQDIKWTRVQNINGLQPDTPYSISFQGCDIVDGKEVLTKQKTIPFEITTLVDPLIIQAKNESLIKKFNNFEATLLMRYICMRFINILFLGAIGNGKTAGHNTFMKALQGQAAKISVFPGAGCTTNTNQLHVIELNESRNIKIFDFWGFSKQITNDNFFTIAMKIFRKGGTTEIKYENRNNLEKIDQYLLDGDINSRMHVVCIPINIAKYQGETVTSYLNLIQNLKDEKIEPQILLTHFDEWYKLKYNKIFSLPSVPKDLIQECKRYFMTINQASEIGNIIPNQEHIQVIIGSSDGQCCQLAQEQLAFDAIEAIMNVAYNVIYQYSKSKLCILDQNNNQICSIDLPERSKKLDSIWGEIKKSLENQFGQNNFFFVDQHNNNQQIPKVNESSIRIEDIMFRFALSNDQNSKINAVRIQVESSYHKNNAISLKKQQQEQSSQNQSNGLNINEGNQQIFEGNSIQKDNEEVDYDEDDEEEKENNFVLLTKEYFDKKKPIIKKSKATKSKIQDQTVNLFQIVTQDNDTNLIQSDDQNIFMPEVNKDQTLDQFKKECDIMFRQQNGIQLNDIQTSQNSQIEEYTEEDDGDDVQAKKPVNYYANLQFVKLLYSQSPNLYQFEYIPVDKEANYKVSDILDGQNIIFIEPKEKRDIEKHSDLMIRNIVTKEYELLKGININSEQKHSKVREKLCKYNEKMSKAQFVDSETGRVYKYNKEKGNTYFENQKIGTILQKDTFAVLNYTFN